uniref:CipC protein n=1 Tax=Mycena chlorophos TaxID=658473 RepID=A0ABQ0MBS5_MYCCL|nr:predicted protein [Mycena chlorophos]
MSSLYASCLIISRSLFVAICASAVREAPGLTHSDDENTARRIFRGIKDQPLDVIPHQVLLTTTLIHNPPAINMGILDSFSSESALFQEYNGKHKTDISHQLLAGAAAFVAAKEYEKHCEQNGKPQTHAEAKELLAGFAGAFIDREVETHGLDAIDVAKAKYEAHKVASEKVAEVDYS